MKTIDLYLCYARHVPESVRLNIARVKKSIESQRKNWRVIGARDVKEYTDRIECPDKNIIALREKFKVLTPSIPELSDENLLELRPEAFLYAGDQGFDLMVVIVDEETWDGGIEVGIALSRERKILFVSSNGSVPEKISEICLARPKQALLCSYDQNLRAFGALVGYGAQVVSMIDQAIERFKIEPSDSTSVLEELNRIESEHSVLAGKLP